jgi:hypothetical protein
VIGEAAARAVAVLERIHEDRTEWLFGAVRVGPGAGSAGRSGNSALTGAGTNRQLNRFTRWVNDYCAATGRSDAIPDVDGRPWHITTRQFRRTLAWFIARRPGGVIAGAIAYRHHSIQTFEGYAGTSDSGFRAEVEAEQALARAEHLLPMIDHNEHSQLRGPASAEAQQRLTELGDQARFADITITDRRRLQRLMNRDDPAVYVGRYATCVYDHTKALCHARVGLGGQAAKNPRPGQLQAARLPQRRAHPGQSGRLARRAHRNRRRSRRTPPPAAAAASPARTAARRRAGPP